MKFISKKELKLRLILLEKRVETLEENYLTKQIKKAKKPTTKSKTQLKKAQIAIK